MVTEQPQYSVVVCIFPTWQNTEISLISNGLRFIFTYSLSLALAITFHMARHTFATLALTKGVQFKAVSKMLGHSSLKTTEEYAAILNKDVDKGYEMFEKQISG